MIVIELLQPGADPSWGNLGVFPGFDIKCKLFESYFAVLADLGLDAFPYAVGLLCAPSAVRFPSSASSGVLSLFLPA